MAKRATGGQFGALPCRIDDQGAVQFLLVTSRETRQWIFPKGNPMRRKGSVLKGFEVAAIECLQEAGVGGKVDMKPLGRVVYDRRLIDGHVQPCRVSVYLLRVKKEMSGWREQGQRQRAWYGREQALACLLANTHLSHKAEIEPLLQDAEQRMLKKQKGLGRVEP